MPAENRQVRRMAGHGAEDQHEYRRREVGRWGQEGELPEPTWYF